MKIQSKVQAQINVSKLNISVFQSPKLKRKHRILTHRKHVKILIYGQKLSNLIYTFLQMLYVFNSTDCDLISSTVLGLLDQLQIF